MEDWLSPAFFSRMSENSNILDLEVSRYDFPFDRRKSDKNLSGDRSYIRLVDLSAGPLLTFLSTKKTRSQETDIKAVVYY